MQDYPQFIKSKLNSIIKEMDQSRECFVGDPGKDFTRNRKISFESVISLIVSMGGNSINKELLEYFRFDENTLSASAFVQQRNKILPSAFQFLLNEFNYSIHEPRDHKGYRLLAVDGTDLNIFHNPNDEDTYICRGSQEKGYNLLHLNAMYDLCNKRYMDALVQPAKHVNESTALVDMVDRSPVTDDVILIADRGYESYNAIGHIEQKGWNYVIRVKDVKSNGIASKLALPATGEFDTNITLKLTRKQNKAIKAQSKSYKKLSSTTRFDYLNEAQEFYEMTFRVVRFKISEDTYETLLTNLDQAAFSVQEIKEFYHLRWGIETSFREVKYAVGLTSFHSKKVDFITQEIFARLVMYNFCEMITMHVIIKKKQTKHAYQANFSMSILICKKYFSCRVDEKPPNVEALIRKYILPIRDERKYPRNIRRGSTVSFLYRVA